jgi:hypothetical protein
MAISRINRPKGEVGLGTVIYGIVYGKISTRRVI